MNAIIVGTICPVEVTAQYEQELVAVRAAIKTLVNARPFGEHTSQDLDDYLDLRKQEEKLKAILS